MLSRHQVITLRHPIRLLARYRTHLLLGILCLIGTNLVAQSIPWLTKRAIEAFQSATAGDRGQTRTAVQWTIGIIGLAILQAGIRIPSRIFIFNTGRQAEYELRDLMFAHLCRLDGKFYRSMRTGDLMSRLTNDLTAIRSLFGPGVLNAVNTTFAYGMALPMMLSIDRELTLWAILPYPILLTAARGFARRIYVFSRAQQSALAAMTSHAQEDLAGMQELKSYCLEEIRGRSFAESSANYLRQAMKLTTWRNGMLPFIGAGSGISIVLVLWIGGQKVIAGKLTLGDLVALNMYVGMLAWPTTALGWMISMWQRGISAWDRLRELLAAEPELVSPLKAQPVDATALTIDVRELSITHEGRSILDRVSFVIPKGSLCAVVGRLGSGKTALAEAVARLTPVAPGTLFFNGTDVTVASLEAVRSLISYAPQDSFLFSATVAENIALGFHDDFELQLNPEQRARVQRAAHLAGLDEESKTLPNGLDTVVGERGITLSGGQRQRVALARALASGRPLLILDDSLSAIDAETEQTILRGLNEAIHGTTTLLISHRLSALQYADHILVLDQGKVVEQGTHESLIERGGVYAQLYRYQLLRAETA